MAINGREYGSTGPSTPIIEGDSSSSPSKVLNLGKVFGVMFIWLLATAAISFGVGFLFHIWLGDAPYNEQAANTLLAVMIASGIGLIALTFLIQYFALKQGKGMIILSSLYVLFMGLLCSSMILFIDWAILGIAFGVTSIIFGVLAAIGLLAKNVKPIAMIAIMAFVGAAITGLITWIMILIIGPTQEMIRWYWIVDFVIFGAMLLLTIVDVNRINKICASGEVSTNLTLYCALTLYSDFIYIFIRVAYYLAIAFGNNR